jgi:hypothetical protein
MIGTRGLVFIPKLSKAKEGNNYKVPGPSLCAELCVRPEHTSCQTPPWGFEARDPKKLFLFVLHLKPKRL